MSERFVQFLRALDLQPGDARTVTIPETEAVLTRHPDRLVTRLHNPLVTLELTISLSDQASVTPETPASSTVTPPTPEEQAQRARVVLTGRVGRTPDLKALPTGKQVAKFPLAVREGERTIWHTILAFDALAEKTAQTLLTGQTVTVIGYQHNREVPLRSGAMKNVTEIFAAAVRTPKPPHNPT